MNSEARVDPKGTDTLGFVAGVAIGALIGLLVGLSESAVVRDVLIAALALLTSFFGLRAGSSGASVVPTVRLVGFAMGAFATVLVAVYIRDHRALSPTLESEVAALERVYSSEDAKRIVLVREFGDIPPGIAGKPWSASFDVHEGGPPGATPSSLMAAQHDRSSCDDLVPGKYEDLDARKAAFLSAKGAWEQSVASVEATKLPANTQEWLLRFWSAGFCGTGEVPP